MQLLNLLAFYSYCLALLFCERISSDKNRTLPDSLRTTILNGVNSLERRFYVRVRLVNEHYFCGGSIVAPYWVITAAHCAAMQDPSALEIEVSYFTLKERLHRPHAVSEIHHPPEYTPLNWRNHDIALVKLLNPIEEGYRSIPICKSYQAPFTRLALCGMGIKYFQEFPTVLQEASFIESPYMGCNMRKFEFMEATSSNCDEGLVSSNSEKEIRNEAHKRDMITSTNNCVVSVLVHDGNEKTKFVKVEEVEDLDNLDAVKKRQATERSSVEKLSPHNKRHCFGRE
ncbi:trypsin-like [Convolutriloba macropyga]|uniref:trypsin-like n=1 Tax=Convolutriloba macropyga TaxID=536237 RepID=UPI003F51F3AF